MKSFRTVRYETGKDTGKAALTFAHLSDLHGCFYGENQEGLLEAIYEADPDLVVVSGDMIVGKPGINRKTFAFFKELTAKYPVFSATETTRAAMRRRRISGRFTSILSTGSGKTAWRF